MNWKEKVREDEGRRSGGDRRERMTDGGRRTRIIPEELKRWRFPAASAAIPNFPDEEMLYHTQIRSWRRRTKSGSCLRREETDGHDVGTSCSKSCQMFIPPS